MTGDTSAYGDSRGGPRIRRRSGEAGFTLVEMAVTVAIVAVLAAVAIPSFTNVLPKVKLGSAVQKLSNVIAMARMSAIAKSVDAEVVLEPTADSYYLRKTVGGAQFAATRLGAGVSYDHASGSDLAIVKFLKDDSVATGVTTLRLYANGTVDLFKSSGDRVAWDLLNERTSVYFALQAKDGAFKRRVVVSMMGRIYTEKWTGGTSWMGD